MLAVEPVMAAAAAPPRTRPLQYALASQHTATREVDEHICIRCFQILMIDTNRRCVLSDSRKLCTGTRTHSLITYLGLHG